MGERCQHCDKYGCGGRCLVNDRDGAMMMVYKGGGNYLFSTGRELNASRGMLSVSADPEETGRLCEGYDGNVFESWGSDPDSFTIAERRELADFMIAEWNKWAAHVPPTD